MAERTRIAKLTGADVLCLLTDRWQGLEKINELCQAAVEKAGLRWEDRIAGTVYLMLEECKGHGITEREVDRSGYVYRLTTKGVELRNEVRREDARPEPAVVIALVPPQSIDRE